MNKEFAKAYIDEFRPGNYLINLACICGMVLFSVLVKAGAHSIKDLLNTPFESFVTIFILLISIILIFFFVTQIKGYLPTLSAILIFVGVYLNIPSLIFIGGAIIGVILPCMFLLIILESKNKIKK